MLAVWKLQILVYWFIWWTTGEEKKNHDPIIETESKMSPLA